jgi:2-C-methyl-D-erythritol 4-phosphate cytidylyltransferase
MYRGLSVGAIIAAAGKSRRMGLNKQFIDICGIPVLAHTLMKFNNLDLIDRIVLVTGEEDIEYCSKSITEKYKINKVSEIISGGHERQNSVFNGINALMGKCGIIITHDGARPFITPEIIERSIEGAYTYGAAACAVHVKDTIRLPMSPVSLLKHLIGRDFSPSRPLRHLCLMS